MLQHTKVLGLLYVSWEDKTWIYNPFELLIKIKVSIKNLKFYFQRQLQH